MQRTPLTPLARVLKDEGRRQSWLAERLGVAEVQVWRWVHGMHDPADETKARIAEILGRTVEEFWPSPGHEKEASTTTGASQDALGEAA